MKTVIPPNVHPHVYVLFAFLTAVATVSIYNFTGFDSYWFLSPLIALTIIYSAINFYRQHRQQSDFQVLKNIHWPLLIKKAIARYLVWLIIILLASITYKYLPYYSTEQFKYNFIFFEQLLYFYVFAGLPYFIVTLKFKSSRKEDFYDPAIRIIHIGKQILLYLFREESNQKPLIVFNNTYNKKVLLNLVMRFYFVPIMIIQVAAPSLNSLSLIDRLATDQKIFYFLYLATSILWLTDIINASLSYCLESRWLENRSRSIDLTATGWIVCLCCYAPLNYATGYIFPFAPFVATNNPQELLIPNLNLLIGVKILEVLFLCLHVYSDVSLGPSITNITLKKLQTKGPYSFIRHPGTTSKLSFWLIQSIFYRKFWTVTMIYGYVMWAVIYISRALTEERHLKKFPEYREYMQKVKHRFIPWLF